MVMVVVLACRWLVTISVANGCGGDVEEIIIKLIIMVNVVTGRM